jgi:tetratricopeptide (TPR) repeat protein
VPVGLAPNFLEGRILLGDYYAGLEENELARDQYLAAIALNHEFEIANLRLGLSYLQSSELDDAQEAFLRAIEINPSSYEAFYYLGNIALLRGDLELARERYEESLKFVLNFPDATYALGAVLFRQGMIDTALEQFEKVLRLNRSHADAYFSRATIRAQRNQFGCNCRYGRAIALYENQDSMRKPSLNTRIVVLPESRSRAGEEATSRATWNSAATKDEGRRRQSQTMVISIPALPIRLLLLRAAASARSASGNRRRRPSHTRWTE